MRGIRMEKEVEIYATNLSEKTKCMSIELAWAQVIK
jgi:hypothetical protein